VSVPLLAVSVVKVPAAGVVLPMGWPSIWMRPEASGAVSVRVVEALMPESWKARFLELSALS
jgi:hypothetical protein